MENQEKTKLKGGEREKEDLNNKDSIEEQEKGGEMAKGQNTQSMGIILTIVVIIVIFLLLPATNISYLSYELNEKDYLSSDRSIEFEKTMESPSSDSVSEKVHASGGIELKNVKLYPLKKPYLAKIFNIESNARGIYNINITLTDLRECQKDCPVIFNQELESYPAGIHTIKLTEVDLEKLGRIKLEIAVNSDNNMTSDSDVMLNKEIG